MAKRSRTTKERDAQAAVVCGEAFQGLAGELIPRIGAIKEEAAQAISNDLGGLVACAVNLGFAVELYLKALLTQLDLPVPQVHDLRTLYDAIPQPVRALIEDVYDTAWPDQVRRLGGRASITLAKGPLEKPLWDDYTKVPLALPDLLTRSRDLFESWRYVFEFSHPENSPYEFHQFEYGLLWCAAEAIRVEVRVRLGEPEGAPASDSHDGGS